MTGPGGARRDGDRRGRPRVPGGRLPAHRRPPPGVDPLDGTVTRDRLGVGPAPGRRRRPRARPAGRRRVGRAGWWPCAWAPESVDPVLRRCGRPGRRRRPGPAGRRGRRPPLRGRAGRRRTRPGPHAGSPRVAPFGRPDLVLCGDRSVDRGTGALPAYLAHELGATQALGLVALEVAGGPDSGACWSSGASTPDGASACRCRCPRCARWRGPARACAGPRCPVSWRSTARRSRSTARPPWSRPRCPGALHVGPPGPTARGPGSSPPPADDDPRLRLLALTGALVAHDPPTVVHPADAAEAADVLLGVPGPSRLPRRRSPSRGTAGRDPPGRRPLAGGRRPGRRPAAVLVVPLGATEQHGPHLPVTTDAEIAVAVVETAAAARPAPGGRPRSWPTARAASTTVSPAPSPSARRPPSRCWSSWAAPPPTRSPTWCSPAPTAATPRP